MTGRVKSVNSSPQKGTVKQPVQEGLFITEHGLKDDAHAGSWHRQVSLLSQESIDKMTEITGKSFSPGDFAENITTEGIELYTLPVGTRLRIGTTIQEISQIGKKCHSDCEIRKSTGNCIMPKEGIFTRVITDGTVKAGDWIEVIEVKDGR